MYEFTNHDFFFHKPIRVFICIGISMMFSCNIINPDETIPSYIHIDKIDLATTYATEGSTSAKITDAWLYLDDQPVGVYELPATIPLLKSGNHKLIIAPGIKMNGISATRVVYPFYRSYIPILDLKAGEKLTINPTINYFSGITFDWKEDFEGFGISLIKGTSSDTAVYKTTNAAEVFEGNGSGIIVLDGSKTFFEGVSSTSFAIPKNSNAFLELNYKSNNTFYVGLYASTSSQPFEILAINPSSTWNKIYVNMGPVISSLNAPAYTIIIGMVKDSGNSTATLYLDNIKLIHS